MNKKIYVVFFILAALGGVAFVAAMTSESWTINVPAGVTPTPTPSPTPVPTTTFGVVANTLSPGVTISQDTKTITIPEGAEVGTVYQIQYTILNTANQPLTITPNVSAVGITTSWDKTALTLPVSQSGTMVLSITLGESSASISVSFTSVASV